MSKKRMERRSNNYDIDNYWESAGYNASLFLMYRQQIMKLAMNRYKWINLPVTCDERYLEYTLLTQGCATISFPKKMQGIFFSTQVANMSPYNIYDNPTQWISIGNNGWRFKCNNRRGVIVWDNRPRYPTMQMIEIFARELVDIRRCKQLNRMHTKTPYIIKCAPEQIQQATNIYKQIAGGEPAIIQSTGMESVDIDVLKTDVPFLGDELTQEESQTWANIYQCLGIKNLTFKAERMVQDEVRQQDEPTTIIELDGINTRKEACDRLNKLFGAYLVKPIDCVKAQDNNSDNYNTLHDVKTMLDLQKGSGANE